MQIPKLEALVRTAKGATAEGVREALETIRQVEQLGGKRSQYNLAAPFSSLGSPGASKPPAPKTAKPKARL